jgi:hypothetical protein
MGQVEGKVAIVTGGAYGLTAISSRMGSITCGRMQQRGHSHIQSLGSKPYDRGALLRLKIARVGIGVNGIPTFGYGSFPKARGAARE